MCKIKITHLTSVHQRYDTRIFSKESISLSAQKGFFVSLFLSSVNVLFISADMMTRLLTHGLLVSIFILFFGEAN